MYADDAHLTYADKDICSIKASLNRYLSNINYWFIANKLTLNMTKTEFMLIGSKQQLNSPSALPGLEITNGTQLNGPAPNSGPLDVATKNSFPLFLLVERVWYTYIKTTLISFHFFIFALLQAKNQFSPLRGCSR